ncbi:HYPOTHETICAL PROTEIN, WS0531 [Wolinella succinogenes]|uniref:Prepilin-type N-terminal cleavage/methylation domain-containing protein n=2 Tax=Wolinella succinogenes TaxID=844 RepID=Q7MSE8_WOLSU|nr:prepilin-type N-terminal cleavage/methylation domain-containing protein [Wolinella succinogenes]CAE09667.1 HYPOTHETICAL PROTEIN, WS0531 [Wolinella succinogenes]HCZ19288.1 prepilin-type N-terminal cleavage/methylation domain-containing protein [Helicobacter sp.]
MKHSSAFTMIEIVFVIVILGILAAIAMPKLALGRSDACITKLRGEISAVRSTINLEQSKEFLLGNAPTLLPQAKLAKLLSLSTQATTCGWNQEGENFTAFVGTQNALFTLTSTSFDCADLTNKLCLALTQRTDSE